MWSKINADKLKMELSGKREKQQQSVTNEKNTEDNMNIKMDSGFLSDANLSCDNVLSNENIEYDQPIDEKSHKNMTITTTLDSGLDIGESDCLSELDIDQKEIHAPSSKNEHNWKLYFQQNEDGDTQLHLAIIHEYTDVSKQLIDICPDSKYLDLRNDDGQTALHLAVMTNQCEIVKFLMTSNVNPEILDCNGNTAVHLACYYGKLDCLRILDSYVFLSNILDTINYDGLACIHIATISNHLNVLRFIVNNSKNVNITDYKSGYTALHFAVALNKANLIECLLDKIDPNIESYAGKLAFEFGDDYDNEDEEDDETSDNLVKSLNVLQFPYSPIKC